MTLLHCSCGYTTADDAEYADHFLEAFTPAGDTGTDGQAHAEVARDKPDAGMLRCLCGYTATDLADLNEHLLVAFTPDDHMGQDGLQHVDITGVSGEVWQVITGLAAGIDHIEAAVGRVEDGMTTILRKVLARLPRARRR